MRVKLNMFANAGDGGGDGPPLFNEPGGPPEGTLYGQSLIRHEGQRKHQQEHLLTSIEADLRALFGTSY
jgi:hypothetical protein